jgi:proline iminopeptidase
MRRYLMDIMAPMAWRRVPGTGADLVCRAFASGDPMVGGDPVVGADPVVIVPGGPGLSCTYLFALAEAIAGCGVQAVCYQPRGVPPSSWPRHPTAGAFSFAGLAEDVEAVRVAFGGGRVHLVAHSFGGYVAWAYLAQPDRVASLTLINACSPDLEANARGDRLLRQRVFAARRRRPPSHDLSEQFHADLPAYLHDPEGPVPAELASAAVDDRVRDAVIAADNDEASLRENAAAFRGPAAVLVGESDPLGIGVAEASLAALASADAALVVLPAAGHFPWLEPCAPSFEAALRGQLSRCLSSPA